MLRPRSFLASGLLVVLGLSTGCSKIKSLLGKNDEPDSGAVTVAPSAAGSVSEGDASLCKVESHKVWTKWANRRTGITVTYRDEQRFALGVGVGNRPQVLAFDENGEGKLSSVPLRAKSPLADDMKAATGTRDLQRVTPAWSGGRWVGYADYRDKYKNGRRRIACGRSDEKDLLVFAGKPILDDDGKPADKPDDKPPPKPSVAGKARRFKLPIKTLVKPDAGSPDDPPVEQPPAIPDDKPELKKRRELRDCRSFVDAGATSAWAVGSELVGEEKDGKEKWSMELFSVSPNVGRSTLYSFVLPDKPDKLHTFEAPVAERLSDGRFVLFTRHQSTLLGFLLSQNRLGRQSYKRYRGGHPSLPHFIKDGLDFLLLTSQKVGDADYALRYARIDGQKSALPAELSQPEIDVAEHSRAEPTLARAGEQRWLAFHAGDRRSASVLLTPVDAELKSSGAVYKATSGVGIYESHLFGLPNGKLLLVYIVDDDSAPELVSQVLSCQSPG